MKLVLTFSGMIAITAFLSGCALTRRTPSFTIESFDSAQGPIAIEGNERDGRQLDHSGGKGWYGFTATVPAAGRYRCEVQAKATGQGQAQFWVEDYVGNPDDRTYSITGPMLLRSGQEGGFQNVTKEGCPLNEGEHSMRLHVEGGPVAIRSVRFVLLRPHRGSPRQLRQNMAGEEWVLKWSDEFDGKGLPNPDVWTHDLGNWGWGNNEPQYYTENREENARKEDGHLIIEARRNDLGHEWTSARLTTRGKVSFLYGKIEIRAKVPAGKGTWAAGWLLGDDYVDEKSWPYCGEVDVLESVGREFDAAGAQGINHASCHTRAYYFKKGNQISSTIPVPNMATEFHTYAIEWYPDGIKAFLDGKHYYAYDKLNGPLEWPFDRPQNLVLNLAMGGGMGQAIDPALNRERLVIDYVRVYETKAER